MATDIYVALSGHVALERRLATIANNVANLNTTGFRAEEVNFEAILSSYRESETAFATEGGTYISRRAGGVEPTGNPLDLAIDGDGWFAVGGENGEVAYTRDGRFQMAPEGDLLTASGQPVLDAGGGPIALDPRGGPVAISRDGAIVQNERRVAVVGLFLIPETATLQRAGDTAVVPNAAAVPVDDFVGNGVRQGFLEGANVDPVMEISRMVLIQRHFDSLANALDRRDRTIGGAIRDLGPGG